MQRGVRIRAQPCRKINCALTNPREQRLMRPINNEQDGNKRKASAWCAQQICDGQPEKGTEHCGKFCRFLTSGTSGLVWESKSVELNKK